MSRYDDGPCTRTEADDDDADRYLTRPDCTGAPVTNAAPGDALARVTAERNEARAEVEEMTHDLRNAGEMMLRAEAARDKAKAEVERLRGILGDSRCGDVPALVRSWTDQSAALASIAMLADELEEGSSERTVAEWLADLRALLAPSEAPSSPVDAMNPPVPTTGESKGVNAAQSGREPCRECGHVHTPTGCSGPPTPSDLWAGVTPAGCDCEEAPRG